MSDISNQTTDRFYPIGTPLKPWTDSEKASWFSQTIISRSYSEEVLSKVWIFKERFNVEQYGALSQDPEKYPLFVIKTRNWDVSKGCVLVTGGTHGYETSGVQGALLFVESEMEKYSKDFNIAVIPCVSPWSYESIQRWNATCIDPNRSYYADTPCEECSLVIELLKEIDMRSNSNLDKIQWLMHLDLHETTDSDLSEFLPAKAARDGLPLEDDIIPDGFYLIGNKLEPQHEWHKAMIASVRSVTHIAPGDKDNCIMGLPLAQEGVVNSNSEGKGKGVTNATYASTTEVYPDSKATPVTGEQCNRAQVACITGGLDFLLRL